MAASSFRIDLPCLGGSDTSAIEKQFIGVSLSSSSSSTISGINLSTPDEIEKQTIERVWQMIQEKKALKGTLDPQQWNQFKQDLRELRTNVLPFRIIDIVKQSLKTKQPIPDHIEKQLIEKGQSKWLDSLKAADDVLQKDLLLAWERGLVEEILKNDELKETLKLFSTIRWIHGTNSATFAMLPFLDFRLFPTGHLLSLYGVAPMAGELSGGGMGRGGVNQRFISAGSVREFKRIWNDYASQIRFTFDPEIFAEFEKSFTTCLDELFQNDPESWEWEVMTITLNRMKQWHPDEFLRLLDKHQEQIQTIFRSKTSTLSPCETKILLALDYPIEKLRQAFIENDADALDEISKRFGRFPAIYYQQDVARRMKNPDDAYRMMTVVNKKRYPQAAHQDDYELLAFITDIFSWRLLGLLDEAKAADRPYGQAAGDLNQVLRTLSEERIRFNEQFVRQSIDRLKLTLNPKHWPVTLSESDRELIVNPFPMIFGSTKNRAHLHHTGCELLVSGGVQLGEEIDLIFVRDKEVEFVLGWLKERGLEGKVHVLSESKLKCVLNSSVPLFHAHHQVTGSNTLISSSDYGMQADAIEKSIRPLYNKSYIHHGPIHMSRVALLSAVAVEFYAERGFKATINASNIPLIAALHDVGRKNDMGEDLWDQDSSDMAARWAQESGKDLIEVETFRRGILEKDDNNSDLLAAKCVGTADCWDIIRALYNPKRDFKIERLMLSRDFPDDPLVRSLTQEVMEFVCLTESPKIKEILSQSEDLYRDLFRVMKYAQKLSGKMTYMEGLLGKADVSALGVDFSTTTGLSANLEIAIQEYFKQY